jgi:hypothetical protein
MRVVGIHKVRVVPTPAVLATSIFPAIASMLRLEIDRPSPVIFRPRDDVARLGNARDVEFEGPSRRRSG